MLEGLRPPPAVEVLALGSLAQGLRTLGRGDVQRVTAESVARVLVPPHLWREPAPFHRHFWGWLDDIKPDEAPPPYVAIWFRGSGKSTSAEMAVVTLGANSLRHYILYVCRTQDRADDHVQNIAAMLESRVVAERWPNLATRAVGKFGNVKAWRRSRLVTRGGLVVDALGLDTAVRGVKIDFRRPDAAVLDDIDHHADSELVIGKRLVAITQGLLPALTANAAICICQNLVHPDGVVARLEDGRADFLGNALIDGPIPAVAEFKEVRTKDGTLPSGKPTWKEGFGPAAILAEWGRIGATAFKREMQHDVHSREGAMFGGVVWRRVSADEVPPLEGREMWIDPAVGAGAEGSLCGFLAGGRGVGSDGRVRFYVEWAWEERMTPEHALRFAAAKAAELGITTIGVETDQGGETWRPLARLVFEDYEVAQEAEAEAEGGTGEEPVPGDASELGTEAKKTGGKLAFLSAKAGSTGQSKYERWLRLLAGYERGEIVHVEDRSARILEQALLRLPEREPFDLADVTFWAWWSVLDKRRGGWRVL